MTTQDGETWLDGQNGFGTGYTLLGRNALSKISAVRFRYGSYEVSSSNCSFAESHLNNCSSAFYSNQNARFSFDFKSWSYNAGNAGWLSLLDGATGTIAKVNGNNGGGLSVIGEDAKLTVLEALNNSTYGLQFDGSDSVISGIALDGNGTGGVLSGTTINGTGKNFLIDAVIGDAVEVGSPIYTNTRLWSKNHDGVAGYNVCFTDSAFIYNTTFFRHTASGIAWAIDVQNPTYRTSDYPVDLEYALVGVAANALVTVSAWMLRTNTALGHRLVCKGGQIAGVAADVSSAMTKPGMLFSSSLTRIGVTATVTIDAHGQSNNDTVQVTSAGAYNGVFVIFNVTVNTFDYTMSADPGVDSTFALIYSWEKVTITFTPTEQGVVRITTETYGGTTDTGFVDGGDPGEVMISQA